MQMQGLFCLFKRESCQPEAIVNAKPYDLNSR